MSPPYLSPPHFPFRAVTIVESQPKLTQSEIRMATKYIRASSEGDHARPVIVHQL